MVGDLVECKQPQEESEVGVVAESGKLSLALRQQFHEQDNDGQQSERPDNDTHDSTSSQGRTTGGIVTV